MNRFISILIFIFAFCQFAHAKVSDGNSGCDKGDTTCEFMFLCSKLGTQECYKRIELLKSQMQKLEASFKQGDPNAQSLKIQCNDPAKSADSDSNKNSQLPKCSDIYAEIKAALSERIKIEKENFYKGIVTDWLTGSKDQKIKTPICNLHQGEIDKNYLGESCGEPCKIRLKNYTKVKVSGACTKEKSYIAGLHIHLFDFFMNQILSEIKNNELKLTNMDGVLNAKNEGLDYARNALIVQATRDLLFKINPNLKIENCDKRDVASTSASDVKNDRVDPNDRLLSCHIKSAQKNANTQILELANQELKSRISKAYFTEDTSYPWRVDESQILGQVTRGLKHRCKPKGLPISEKKVEHCYEKNLAPKMRESFNPWNFQPSASTKPIQTPIESLASIFLVGQLFQNRRKNGKKKINIKPKHPLLRNNILPVLFFLSITLAYSLGCGGGGHGGGTPQLPQFPDASAGGSGGAAGTSVAGPIASGGAANKATATELGNIGKLADNSGLAATAATRNLADDNGGKIKPVIPKDKSQPDLALPSIPSSAKSNDTLASTTTDSSSGNSAKPSKDEAEVVPSGSNISFESSNLNTGTGSYSDVVAQARKGGSAGVTDVEVNGTGSQGIAFGKNGPDSNSQSAGNGVSEAEFETYLSKTGANSLFKIANDYYYDWGTKLELEGYKKSLEH